MRTPPLIALPLLSVLLAGAPVERTAPPAAAAPPTLVAAAVPACTAPVELAAPETPVDALPRVAAALRSGQLDVLAIGSGTVLGPRGRSEGSFPDQMVRDLRGLLPGVDIRLVVQGERGMTAAAMLPLLERALAERRYTLVLWQTGTVEAVRRLPPQDFARTLEAGAAAVRRAGADLVLVDPPFSRMLEANADLAPYRRTMQDAAGRNGAVLFHRYGLIHHWVDAGQLDLESAGPADRLRTRARLDACLGRALASVVLHATGR